MLTEVWEYTAKAVPPPPLPAPGSTLAWMPHLPCTMSNYHWGIRKASLLVRFLDYHLDIREFHLPPHTVRVVQQWNGLPTEVVSSSSLADFKQPLDKHLTRMLEANPTPSRGLD